MDNISIGRFIQKKRIEKKLTQNDLGEKLYVSGKAVSKWERGLSLPDIGLLEKLADILDTDIYEILQIKNKKNINVEKIIKEEQIKLFNKYKKRLIITITPVVIIILLILFKLIPYGYNIDHIRHTNYTNKIIHLAKPKFSFSRNSKENNYSYKNFRSKYILQSEIKNYVNTLEHLKCNDTIYYYDKVADFTIIDYSISNNFLYNTINYAIRDGNYCNTIKFKEYNKKLGGANKYFTLHTESKSNIDIIFYTTLNKKENSYTGRMEIYLKKGNKIITLEESSGTIEINKDELIYRRIEIKDKYKNIEIPPTSIFVIKNKKLILKDNYLKDYKSAITLS